jgi:hypothetical protein
MIFVIFVVGFLVFLRLMVAVIKRLLPQMVPEMMGQVGANIPNISPKQAVGLLALEFVRSGGVQMLMEKFLGMPAAPVQPMQIPGLQPPGGQP